MSAGWILEKVISGLQTGVDQVALEVARELGYQTGGVAPRGFRTDTGSRPDLGARYGVTEHRVSSSYAPRTLENIRTSDATVIFSVEPLPPGSLETRNVCQQLGKPWILNPTVEELRQFILRGEYRVLNVAGNRLRTYPESADRARVVLRRGLLPFVLFLSLWTAGCVITGTVRTGHPQALHLDTGGISRGAILHEGGRCWALLRYPVAEGAREYWVVGTEYPCPAGRGNSQ